MEYKEHPKGLPELWERVGKEWINILASVHQNLDQEYAYEDSGCFKDKGWPYQALIL